jgi:RNA recognition motif-containing protein
VGRSLHDHPDKKEFSMQGRQEYTTWNNPNFDDSYDYKKSSHKTQASVPCAGGSASNNEGGTRVFVQNLPEFYEESHLKQLFSSYGEITDVTIQRDRNGKSMQCGFVVFDVSSHANSAHEALDGVMLSTQTLVIHVM